MALPLNYDGGPIHHPKGGESYDLALRGATWASASVTVTGDSASICCTHPQSPWMFPCRVQVEIQRRSSARCVLYGNVEGSLPECTRVVAEQHLGQSPRHHSLVDGAGHPWAVAEIGEDVRFFDLAGLERVRISAAPRHRLELRCWDEQGNEILGQDYLMP